MSFQPANPFLTSLTRMQLPSGMGRSISIAGFGLEADDEGCVEVPVQYVDQLTPHGLIVVPPKAQAPKTK
jgi:hypothetical protein